MVRDKFLMQSPFDDCWKNVILHWLSATFQPVSIPHPWPSVRNENYL